MVHSLLFPPLHGTPNRGGPVTGGGPVLGDCLELPSYMFNISFSQLHFSGEDIVTCIFGGFTLMDISGGPVAPEQAFCSPVNPKAQLKRSILSGSSNVYLYRYAYPGYSQIELELKIQTTKCKHVLIDPCLSYSHCSSPMCNLQLEGEGIIVTHWSHVVGVDKLGISYKLDTQNTECVVLQVRRVLNSVLLDTVEHCTLLLEPDAIDTTSVIHHCVRTFLQMSPNTHESLLILSEVNKAGDYYSYSDSNKSSVMGYVNLGSHTTQAVGNRRVCDVSNVGNSKTDFVGQFKLEVMAEYFAKGMIAFVYDSFSGWSSSWIDISVWLSNNTEQHQQEVFLSKPSRWQQFPIFWGSLTFLQKLDTVLLHLSDSENLAKQWPSKVYHIFVQSLVGAKYGPSLYKGDYLLLWATMRRVPFDNFELSLPSVDFKGKCYTT